MCAGRGCVGPVSAHLIADLGLGEIRNSRWKRGPAVRVQAAAPTAAMLGPVVESVGIETLHMRIIVETGAGDVEESESLDKWGRRPVRTPPVERELTELAVDVEVRAVG